MGYKVPGFNVWCRIRRFDPDTLTYPVYGYVKCQVRGADSHLDVGAGTQQFQVLLPKGADVDDQSTSVDGFADYIEVAGWGGQWAKVVSVTSKGCGFSNEYTIANVFWTITESLPPANSPQPCPVNIDLAPPVGYTPLPIRIRAATWPVA